MSKHPAPIKQPKPPQIAARPVYRAMLIYDPNRRTASLAPTEQTDNTIDEVIAALGTLLVNAAVQKGAALHAAQLQAEERQKKD
jgi:hypothetical protein